MKNKLFFLSLLFFLTYNANCFGCSYADRKERAEAHAFARLATNAHPLPAPAAAAKPCAPSSAAAIMAAACPLPQEKAALNPIPFDIAQITGIETCIAQLLKKKPTKKTAHAVLALSEQLRLHALKNNAFKEKHLSDPENVLERYQELTEKERARFCGAGSSYERSEVTGPMAQNIAKKIGITLRDANREKALIDDLTFMRDNLTPRKLALATRKHEAEEFEKENKKLREQIALLGGSSC